MAVNTKWMIPTSCGQYYVVVQLPNRWKQLRSFCCMMFSDNYNGVKRAHSKALCGVSIVFQATQSV